MSRGFFSINLLNGDVYINGRKEDDSKIITRYMIGIVCVIVLLIILGIIGNRKIEYEFQQPKESITSIEVLHAPHKIYNSADACTGAEILADLNGVSIIPKAGWDGFLNRFSQLECRGGSRSGISLDDYMIRITYADHAWELIDERLCAILHGRRNS